MEHIPREISQSELVNLNILAINQNFLNNENKLAFAGSFNTYDQLNVIGNLFQLIGQHWFKKYVEAGVC